MGLNPRKGSAKNATLSNIRKQDGDPSLSETRTGEGSIRQKLIDSKFKSTMLAADEMSFDQVDQVTEGRSTEVSKVSKDEEQDEGDKRHALYLDDKRFVVLITLCLAGLSNFVGYNVIQEYRKEVRIIY